MLRKTLKLAQAISRLPGGASIMIGGFMGVGTPPRLTDAGGSPIGALPICFED